MPIMYILNTVHSWLMLKIGTCIRLHLQKQTKKYWFPCKLIDNRKEWTGSSKVFPYFRPTGGWLDKFTYEVYLTKDMWGTGKVGEEQRGIQYWMKVEKKFSLVGVWSMCGRERNRGHLDMEMDSVAPWMTKKFEHKNQKGQRRNKTPRQISIED